VDIAFFEGFSKTTDGVWPIYIGQQTDYSGCIKYGGGELTDAYTRWTGYGARYPGRYGDEVDKFIADVSEKLTLSTCACGPKESVVKELQAFLRVAPDAPIAADVSERLQALEAGAAGFRFRRS